jgi:inosine-uridine nucleoside N-ribohydrolase
MKFDSERVSEIVCTNGGHECTAIQHSACGTSLKCKCDTGYQEDTTDGTTCVQTTNTLNTNQQSKRTFMHLNVKSFYTLVV